MPATERDGQQQRTDEVERAPDAWRLDAAGDDVDQQERDDPDRHVQQEDPLPRRDVEAAGSAAQKFRSTHAPYAGPMAMPT